MRVAICFSGLARTFWECWASYAKLPTKYECDFFGAAPPDPVLLICPFKRLLLQRDEWINEKDYPQYKNEETSVQNTLRQFHDIEVCNDLRAQYEKERGFRYDWVVRTRCDNLVTREFPRLEDFDHSATNIYIPLEHDHPLALPGVGINDRLAIGCGEVMDIYSRKLSLIPRFMAESGRRFHPETILKWILDQHGINIVRFPACTKINRGNNELL